MWLGKKKRTKNDESEHSVVQVTYEICPHFFYLGRDEREGFVSYSIVPSPVDRDEDFPEVAAKIMAMLCANLHIVTTVTCVVVPQKKDSFENYFPYRYYHSLVETTGVLLNDGNTLIVQSHGFPHDLFEAYIQQAEQWGHEMVLQGYTYAVDGNNQKNPQDSVLYMEFHCCHDYLDISVNNELTSMVENAMKLL